MAQRGIVDSKEEVRMRLKFVERLTHARTRRAAAGVLAAAIVAVAVSPAGATQSGCKAINQSKDIGYNANEVADPLGAAIAEADPGDTVKVIGTCHGNFVISKDLTLQGRPSAEHADTLDGDLSGIVLSVPFGVAANLTISDLTITGGSGAGISWYQGVVTITNTHVVNNAGTGIGKFGAGTAVIEHSVISGNSAISGAGIWNSLGGGGGMTISNSLVTNNTAMFFGGGIFNRGPLAITDSTISNNAAGSDGGGIYSISGSINLANVTFGGNSPNDCSGVGC
jgi:nitrous oxidase accessory protein NosD